MREGQLHHLLARGLDQFLVGVAERGAPEPGHALDVGLAVGVVDPDALSALQHQGPGLAQGGEVGVGVDQGLDVAGGRFESMAASIDVEASLSNGTCRRVGRSEHSVLPRARIRCRDARGGRGRFQFPTLELWSLHARRCSAVNRVPCFHLRIGGGSYRQPSPSSIAATAIAVRSSAFAAMIWTPAGRPCALRQHRCDGAGRSARSRGRPRAGSPYRAARRRYRSCAHARPDLIVRDRDRRGRRAENDVVALEEAGPLTSRRCFRAFTADRGPASCRAPAPAEPGARDRRARNRRRPSAAGRALSAAANRRRWHG